VVVVVVEVLVVVVALVTVAMHTAEVTALVGTLVLEL
jgi:hypothetical protein